MAGAESCGYCETKPAKDTCSKCGKTQGGIDWFARGFRAVQLRKGLPDPGNLCGKCAGGVFGAQLAEEMIHGQA